MTPTDADIQSRDIELEKLSDLIRSRRTTHDFQPDKAPDVELIKSMINTAMYAPNHRMKEPWHFYLIGEETKKEIINRTTEILTELKGPEKAQKKRQGLEATPGWLVVTSAIDDDDLMTTENYAATACAIQNLALLLHSQGIQSKWSTGPVTRDEQFYDICWIDPDKERVAGILWYGYGEEDANVGRKTVAEKLTELA